jgi:spore coat-associated protein N
MRSIKAVSVSILMIGMVAMLAGAGTFAYFVDAEASIGDTTTAGTLDLKINGSDSNVVMFDEIVTKVDSGSNEVTLKNDGSLDGYMDITFSNVVDDENGFFGNEDKFDSTPNDGELAEILHILAYIDENNDNMYDSGTDTSVYDGYAKNIEEERLSNYALNSGTQKVFRIEYSINTNQGYFQKYIVSDKAGFDIEFELAQSETEEHLHFFDTETSNGNTFTAALG